MEAEKVKIDKSQLVIRSNKKLIAPHLTRSNFHHVHVTLCLILMQFDGYVRRLRLRQQLGKQGLERRKNSKKCRFVLVDL